MKTNRRNFIKLNSIAALAAGIAIPEISFSQNASLWPSDIDKESLHFWQVVRDQFPLTKEWAYLNNGTMGPSPYPVIEAVRKGMMDGDQFANYGGWEATSAKIAKFVGANTDEIALTHNVTDGINVACWGFPLKKGDEVILTTHEHVGNAFPWLSRQKLHGIVVKAFTPASTADETLNRINSLITKKTRAIAVPHILCTQGQVLPVNEISKLGKEKGLFVFIDGAHGPGMIHLDLHDMGCDVYASCTHKWLLGPKGTGFLYVRKDFQNTLQTYFVGGGSDNAKWNMATNPIQTGDYAQSAHRYYGGTQSLGLYKGVDAAIDFVENIGLENINRRIMELGKYSQEKLLEFGDKVELLTPVEERSRAAVNGFRIKNVEYQKFYTLCMENKVRIRSVAENGLNSLRMSTHFYNNQEEVDKLMDLIKKV